MSQIRKSVALVAALIIACTGLALTASPAAAVDSDPFVVVQANLGSGKDSDLNGDKAFGGYGSTEDPILAVSDKARVNLAHIVTLQELCREDLERMRAHLTNITGQTWYASQFAQMSGDSERYPNSCQQPGRNGPVTNQDKGSGILSRVPITSDTLSLLGTDVVDGNSITLGCIRVAFAGTTEVCNTHLPSTDANDAIRLTMAKEIKNGIAAKSFGGITGVAHPGVDDSDYRRPTVLAGDFNIGLKTTVMDLFHRIKRDGTGINTTGKFWEADHEFGACAYGFCRDAEKTITQGNFSAKYDYVYYGKTFGKSAGSVNLVPHGNPTSNHQIVVAQSRFVY